MPKEKPETEKVAIDIEGAVVRLTFNDPATLNAMGERMVNDIRDAVQYVGDPENGFRCLVITGAGRGFSSGGSVAWMDSARQEGDGGRKTSHGITLGTHHHYVLKKLRDLPIPIITAVNGPAAGIGFSYALAGDMIVAAYRDAKGQADALAGEALGPLAGGGLPGETPGPGQLGF